MKKGLRKKRRILPLAVVVLILLFSLGYVKDYYHRDESVQEYFTRDREVKLKEVEEGLFLDGTGEENALIFYPGAKVEYTAYLPLLYLLAEQGVDCFIVKMPCNLAFLGKNKAGDIMADYKYDHWYLAGHSLGGAMAASYASGHPGDLDGLALLAAYPTKDLPVGSLSVISIYGSEDGVLNRDKLETGRKYMPDDYSEFCIEGGNHAWFGNYGQQKGDKTATITHEEQQEQAVAAILTMIQ